MKIQGISVAGAGVISLMTLCMTSLSYAKNGILFKHIDTVRTNVKYHGYSSRYRDTRASSVFGPASVEPELLYYGGPIMDRVKVYTVFWGPNINAVIRENIGDFYQALTQSTFVDWFEEYNTTAPTVDGRPGTNQRFERGSYLGSAEITPSQQKTVIQDHEIQEEIQVQVAKGAIAKPDDNTLYMIYFPPGMTIKMETATSCKQFCAYHNGFVSQKLGNIFYGVMPDLQSGGCELGCGGNTDPFDDVTQTSSHEFAEAVTDPFPTPGTNPSFPCAWNTLDGNEVGDLCVGLSTQLISGTKTYSVQQEWDNVRKGCADDLYYSQ